jgi:hypothetical protein
MKLILENFKKFVNEGAFEDAGDAKPLTPREEKDLGRANVYVMDWEVAGGELPPDVKQAFKVQKQDPNAARKVLEWAYDNAPGNFWYSFGG